MGSQTQVTTCTGSGRTLAHTSSKAYTLVSSYWLLLVTVVASVLVFMLLHCTLQHDKQLDPS